PRSARTRWNRNSTMVSATRPRTIFMSVVSASAVSITGCWSQWSGAVVEQVPDPVAEPLAAGFEMCLRPPPGPRHVPARPGAVAQPVRSVEHVPHVFGIVPPIGGKVQAAVRRKLAYQQRDERRLHQSALVVAFFVPRVGEVDPHLVQAGVGDLVLQHLNRVYHHDAVEVLEHEIAD